MRGSSSQPTSVGGGVAALRARLPQVRSRGQLRQIEGAAVTEGRFLGVVADGSRTNIATAAPFPTLARSFDPAGKYS